MKDGNYYGRLASLEASANQRNSFDMEKSAERLLRIMASKKENDTIDRVEDFQRELSKEWVLNLSEEDEWDRQYILDGLTEQISYSLKKT